VWKVNQRWWIGLRVTSMSNMLVEKNTRRRRMSVFQRLGYYKRERSPEWEEMSRHRPETPRWMMREAVDTRVQGFFERNPGRMTGQQGYEQRRNRWVMEQTDASRPGGVLHEYGKGSHDNGMVIVS
jgi:hypothetical protein